MNCRYTRVGAWLCRIIYCLKVVQDAGWTETATCSHLVFSPTLHTHTHTHTHAHRGLYFIRKLSRTASWEAWITPSEPVYVCGCMCIAVILSPQYDKNKCFGHIEKRSKQMSDLWWNTFSFFKFRGIIINVTNPSSNLPCVRTLVTLVTSLDKC